jgi:protein ImuA
VLIRPIASSPDSTPAALRLGVRPTADGIAIETIKRTGSIHVDNLNVTLQPSPILLSPHGSACHHSSVSRVEGNALIEAVA